MRLSAHLSIANSIDKSVQKLSQGLSWLPLAMAALTVFVVVLRYGFGLGAISAQEGVVYLHSALFMLGASCTLLADEHVRVDVFYRNFSLRSKAWCERPRPHNVHVAVVYTDCFFKLRLCGRILVNPRSVSRARGDSCRLHIKNTNPSHGYSSCAASRRRNL